MLKKVSEFFNRLTALDTDQQQDAISLEMACAVLLCEVMRADHEFDAREQSALTQLLSDRFQLSISEINDIVTQALTYSENANGLYTYTALINKTYAIEDKITLVKQLWQLALADGEIAAIEHHTIRKIADLLHLRHSEYVATKPQ